MSDLINVPTAHVHSFTVATLDAIKIEALAVKAAEGAGHNVLAAMVALGVAVAASLPQGTVTAIRNKITGLVPSSVGGKTGDAKHANYKTRIMAALQEEGVLAGIWRDIPGALSVEDFAEAVKARAVSFGARVTAMKAEAEKARADAKVKVAQEASYTAEVEREARVKALENAPTLIEGAQADTEEATIRAALATALDALHTLRSFATHPEALAALATIQQVFVDDAASDVVILAA